MSGELSSGAQKVCPRCGETAGGEIFCTGCGLNLKQQGELPTADAYAARMRERKWLEKQELERQQRAEEQRRRGAAEQERRTQSRQLLEKRWARRLETRRRAQRAFARIGVGLAALLTGVATLAVAWQITGWNAPVVGVSPLADSDGTGRGPSGFDPAKTVSEEEVAESLEAVVAESLPADFARGVSDIEEQFPGIDLDVSVIQGSTRCRSRENTPSKKGVPFACVIHISSGSYEDVLGFAVDFTNQSCWAAIMDRIALNPTGSDPIVFSPKQAAQNPQYRGCVTESTAADGTSDGAAEQANHGDDGTASEAPDGSCGNLDYAGRVVSEIEPQGVSCDEARPVIESFLDTGADAVNVHVMDGWTCSNYGASGPLVCESSQGAEILFRASP